MKRPIWMTALLIVMCLPLFATPTYVGMLPADVDATVKSLVAGYPIYVVVSAVLAWIVYPTRRGVAWILIMLMALSHLAVYMLAHSPQ